MYVYLAVLFLQVVTYIVQQKCEIAEIADGVFCKNVENDYYFVGKRNIVMSTKVWKESCLDTL